MDEQAGWQAPFCEDCGHGMVYRTFTLGGRLYAVGFEKVDVLQDFTHKGGSILKFTASASRSFNNLWAVIFDEIDHEALDFKGFRHIPHSGLSGGRVLFKVARIIFEHYSAARAGAYVFTAATDPLGLRKDDLVDLYSRILGLTGYPKSRLFKTLFNGWQAYSNCASGGREYVVTTDRY